MPKKHLLFVCSSNLDRSPAAESLFEDSERFEARSCGINGHSEVVLTKELVDWADVIFAMQDEHKGKILEFNPKARVLVLGIANDYCRYDPELMELLKGRLAGYLGR